MRKLTILVGLLLVLGSGFSQTIYQADTIIARKGFRLNGKRALNISNNSIHSNKDSLSLITEWGAKRYTDSVSKLSSVDSLIFATRNWSLSTFPQLALQYNDPSWIGTLNTSKLRNFGATNGQVLQYNGSQFVPTTLSIVPTTRTITTASPLQGGGDLSANRTLSIDSANAARDGYLSRHDWTLFNDKAGLGLFNNFTTRNRFTSLIFNKDSVPIITGRQWGFVLDTTDNQLKRQLLLNYNNGVAGRVPFFTDANTLGTDTSLRWDNTNKRLGINTIPENTLDVNGTTYLRGAMYNTSSTYGKRLGFHLGGAKSNAFAGHHVGNLTNVGDLLGEGRNTGFGTVVMPLITQANRCIGLGFSVMSNLRVGIKNHIVGNAGLDNADSVNNNTGFGEHVLRTNLRGNNNTVMGFHSAELAQGSNNVFYGGNVAANQVNGDGNHIFAYNGTVFDPNGSHQMNLANIIYGTNINAGVNARVGIGTNNPGTFFTLSGAAPDLGFWRTGGVANSRNWAFRINGVEEGDFLIYQSAANGSNPLNTVRLQISRVGNLNLGTTATVDNALLNVQSTSRGSMPFPRLTNAQRTALTVDATRVGMHVYQTDGTEGVYVYKSTGWAFAY